MPECEKIFSEIFGDGNISACGIVIISETGYQAKKEGVQWIMN